MKRLGSLLAVEHLRLFVPTRRARVDLTEVEEEVEAVARRYQCPVYLDPYQGVGLSQRLTQRGIRVTEYPFSGDGRRKLFAGLLDLVSTGSLRAHPHETLQRELLSLEVKESLSGWRVDHRASGHDDCVVAVALAVAGLAPQITPASGGRDPGELVEIGLKCRWMDHRIGGWMGPRPRWTDDN